MLLCGFYKCNIGTKQWMAWLILRGDLILWIDLSCGEYERNMVFPKKKSDTTPIVVDDGLENVALDIFVVCFQRWHVQFKMTGLE